MKLLTCLATCLLSFAHLSAMPIPNFQPLGTLGLVYNSEGQMCATLGAIDTNHIKAEIGMGYNTKFTTPTGISAKIGVDEGVGHQYSPSFAVGVFDAGIRARHAVLDHSQVYYALLGRSERRYLNGRGYVGVFHGNRVMGLERKGYFVGYTQFLFPTALTPQKSYDKVALDAVYVSGKSALGGFTLTGKYFVKPTMYIQAGPTWEFNREFTGPLGIRQVSKWSFERVRWVVTFSIDI
jgi:hypothetical protein